MLFKNGIENANYFFKNPEDQKVKQTKNRYVGNDFCPIS